jgi:hypothetical protein
MYRCWMAAIDIERARPYADLCAVEECVMLERREALPDALVARGNRLVDNLIYCLSSI